MKHHNANVFVAGGTSGINLAIAERFAVEGANVAVLSRSRDKVDAAVERLRAHDIAGTRYGGYVADVREYDAVVAALADWHARCGPIDILISGAAGNFLAPVEALSPRAFKSVIDIDLMGTFHVARGALEFLRHPGARIVNITAPQAWLPTAFQAHACAAKAGIDQLTRTLAIEWGSKGIRVNAIAPGPISETEGMQRLAPTPAVVEAITQSIPLRRYGTKREIASVASWLCSDEANYVTGAVIPVDGGWSLGGSGLMSAALAMAQER